MIFSGKKVPGECPILIVGLGNPGKTYETTRHNVGFRAVDIIAEQLQIPMKKEKFKAIIGEGRCSDRKVILAKPQTFMNLSGDAVIALFHFYKPNISDMILIYDDVDIPVGAIRIRPFGSSGTHNGMRSVVGVMNNNRFPRIRIGIGKPTEFVDIRDFVLTKFSQDEKDSVSNAIEVAAHAAIDIISLGIEKSMNIHNPKKKDKTKGDKDDKGENEHKQSKINRQLDNE